MARIATLNDFTMAIESCCSCGITFAMPEGLYRQMRADSDRSFYCPNGHAQHYTDGELQRERKLREQAERREQYQVKRREWAEQEARNMDYKARAAKGQLTKLKKRIAAGVCPCCNRSFQNLRQHIEAKHPELVEHLPEKGLASE